MLTKKDLKQITDFIWEIPKGHKFGMNVPARIFASEKMLDEILSDKSMHQITNVATLPGILGYAYAMPDVHEGYGFPIGGVAATKIPNGVISPGGIGYDINCGVRLLKSEIEFNKIKNNLESLSREIYNWIPSGVGKGGKLKLDIKELDQVLQNGAQWMLKHNYATENDIINIESNGKLENASIENVSEQAKKRGLGQLGTLGSGNHFVEVGFVEEIYDKEIAENFGLFEKQVTVLIHTGSRGLGHQIATDHIKTIMNAMQRYNINIPDKELACVPFNSPEGQNYFNAMAAGANFAWANRQMITHLMRQAWRSELKEEGKELSLLYDVAHNIAKVEEHEIEGKKQTVIVHRKGATRAFAPNHPEIPTHYKNSGQPVIIPGSMGTASYVLAGTEQSMKLSLGSTCHGAGRVMSRRAAKKATEGKILKEELKKQGIFIQAGSISGLAEEAPKAYKNIDEVIKVVHNAGIAKKIAKLKPCVVIKG